MYLCMQINFQAYKTDCNEKDTRMHRDYEIYIAEKRWQEAKLMVEILIQVRKQFNAFCLFFERRSLPFLNDFRP